MTPSRTYRSKPPDERFTHSPSVPMTTAMHAALRQLALRDGVAVTELIRALIQEALDREQRLACAPEIGRTA